MPWAAAAAVGSAAVGAYSANSAAKKGQKASDAAMGLQQANSDANVSRNAPWLAAGNDALASQENLLRTGFGRAPTAQEVMDSPGYQFQRDQGMDTVQQGAAATSGNLSGAALKALDRYGTGFATTKYNDSFQQKRQTDNDVWGRYQQLSTGGQNAAATDAGVTTHAADAMGNIGTGNASFQGAAGIAGANAIGTALNTVGSYGKSSGWFTPSSSGAANGQAGWTPQTLQGSAEPYMNFGAQPTTQTRWADGGPVVTTTRNRMRHYADGGPVMVNGAPMVGSRSPLPVGGGGGLSKNAILELLLAQRAAAASAPGVGASGVGQLPANPLMNPQEILRQRLRAAGEYAGGGPVHGPGGPREDAIEARLSNGEHVIDAATVNAIGGGSNAHGQVALNKLRAMLKAGGC